MSDDRERLPRLTKLLYGSGDLGFSMTSTILAVMFAIYLTDVVGLRPGMAAVAVFIGRSWDYVNDPLVGYLSDRVRSRWGRRRPFLLFGFLPFAAAFALLWWKPPIAGQVGLAVYYACAYLLYDTAATFVYMPYFALTPELTLDYDERTSLTSYRAGFSIVGSIVAFTVPMLIIGTMSPGNAPRVALMGLIFGLVSSLPLLLVFLRTRERPEFLQQALPNLRESFRAALHNRPFLFAMGIHLLTWLAVDIVQTMLLYFIKYRMGLEEQTELITGTIFIMALLALPLWVWASRKWDKRLAYVAGIAFWAAVQIVLVVISPAWGLPVILVLAGLAGIGVGAAHVLPWAIIPDAVEWDEATTGRRHEGTFYSLVTLMQKVASSIAIPLALLMLDRTGYVANSAEQAESVVRGIQVLTGPVPAALLCAGIAFALLYPLGRERHAALRDAAAARRGNKMTASQDFISAIQVRPVSTPRERRIFLEFPWRIYRRDPVWVPPLMPERIKRLDPARSPWFKRGTADLFIAWRGSEPVGTICAAEDRERNAYLGIRDAVIGFFECVDDYAVAVALFEAAADWARARGLNALLGPFNLDYEDGYGVLLEGYDTPQVVLCGHTPPYYREMFERYGFVRGRSGDNIAFRTRLDIPDDDPRLQKLARVAAIVERRNSVTTRPARWDDWDREVDHAVRILNLGLAILPDFSPWDRDAFAAHAEAMRAIIDPDLIIFGLVHGEPVGMALAIPNLNEAIRKADGLRRPWDYLKLGWYGRRRPDCLSFKSVAVDPAYWRHGVFAAMLHRLVQTARAKGYRWMDMSLTSDDNPMTPRLAEHLDAQLYRRYRVYRLAIDDGRQNQCFDG